MYHENIVRTDHIATQEGNVLLLEIVREALLVNIYAFWRFGTKKWRGIYVFTISKTTSIVDQ